MLLLSILFTILYYNDINDDFFDLFGLIFIWACCAVIALSIIVAMLIPNSEKNLRSTVNKQNVDQETGEPIHKSRLLR